MHESLNRRSALSALALSTFTFCSQPRTCEDRTTEDQVLDSDQLFPSADLTTLLDERDQTIRELNRVALLHDQTITALESQVSNLEQVVTDKEATIQNMQQTIERVNAEKAAAEAKLQAHLDFTYLEVRLQFIDVYQDGSGSKDTWSLTAVINGNKYVVWNKKKEISDDGEKKRGKGPEGDEDYHTHDLGQSFFVKVHKGQSLTISIEGKAHDDGHPVKKSSITLRPEDNWGAGKGKIYKGTNTKMFRIGDGNRKGKDADTEYYAYFSVRKI